MSYDVSLFYPDGRAVVVDRHEDGGTFAVGGTTNPDLNVTYNYAPLYGLVWDGGSLRDLHEQRAGDMVARLRKGVELLGTRRYDDYWAPTPGNAGYALSILLRWAEQHPDAVFEVS